MDRFSPHPALRPRRRPPAAVAAARFAVALAALLLAIALLSACRQRPSPRPLPDPITFSTAKMLAGSAIHPETVAAPTPSGNDFTPLVYAA